eukprot:10333094-Heterocapsa_arctica.AAC.1
MLQGQKPQGWSAIAIAVVLVALCRYLRRRLRRLRTLLSRGLPQLSGESMVYRTTWRCQTQRHRSPLL